MVTSTTRMQHCHNKIINKIIMPVCDTCPWNSPNKFSRLTTHKSYRWCSDLQNKCHQFVAWEHVGTMLDVWKGMQMIATLVHLAPKKGWRQAQLASDSICTLYGPCVSHAFLCYSVFFLAVYINTSPEKGPCLNNQSPKYRHLDTRNNHSVQCSPLGPHFVYFVLCWAVFNILTIVM